ncbi:MAG: regulatory protein [Candidatus Atribacteria bacterium]|nr:regulatory protein [Candidatus Atribacteria bacterium]
MLLAKAKMNQSRSAYQKAIKYLGRRWYTNYELCQKLSKAGFSQGEIAEVVETLTEQGYLNDARYVQLYIEEKRATNPKGKKWLQAEFKKKGIPPELIFQYLEKYYPPEKEEEDVGRLARTWLQRGEKREKIVSRLLRRGFDWPLIQRVWAQIEEEFRS